MNVLAALVAMLVSFWRPRTSRSDKAILRVVRRESAGLNIGVPPVSVYAVAVAKLEE